jgi:tetratricopeptide (TPR) repeat protein
VTAVDGTSSVAELYRDASARLDKGDIKGARALYQKALGEEPENAQGHVGLGACAVHEQDLEAARASYRRALELEPKASLAHIGLGSVAYLQSRFREAADHYEAALEIDDAMADAHWGAAVAYEALGDAAKKRAHAGRFLALAPDSALASSAKAMLSEAR